MSTNTTKQIAVKGDLDRVREISMKLSALLEATYGGGGDSFREMADELQDSYMWTCADLAHELRDKLQKVLNSNAPPGWASDINT